MPPTESSTSTPEEGPEARQEGLFADISTLTGMPFPNLLYRLLAEEPGRLESCWRRLRGGLVLVGAPTLRARLLGSLPRPTAPSDARDPLDGQSRTMLTDVLDAYDMGNSCNAVLVRLLLEGTPGHPGSALVRPSPEQAPAARRTLPPMLELGTMSEQVRARVHRLAQLVDPGSGVVPSVFRHVANDEALLDAVLSALEAASADGELDRVHDDVVDRITRTMAEWPVPVAPIVEPGARAVLEPFPTVIPRMLAVSAVLRATTEDAPVP